MPACLLFCRPANLKVPPDHHVSLFFDFVRKTLLANRSSSLVHQQTPKFASGVLTLNYLLHIFPLRPFRASVSCGTDVRQETASCIPNRPFSALTMRNWNFLSEKWFWKPQVTQFSRPQMQVKRWKFSGSNASTW